MTHAIDKREWKTPVFNGLCPNAIDWAQMAAYIDGEGSILINARKVGKHTTEASAFYLKVMVSNTDIRLVVWCKENFGGNYYDANTEKYYEGHDWKRAYHWNVSSTHAAWILWNCFQYFVMKRDQAEIGIKLQESMRFCNKFRNLSFDVVTERRELKKSLLALKAKGRKSQLEQEVSRKAEIGKYEKNSNLSETLDSPRVTVEE